MSTRMSGESLRVGHVERLWRYPVKSMLGEPCDALRLDRRGVEGDRLFALRTADGRIASGKSTRRFRRVEGLFRFAARLRGTGPVISLPGGAQASWDDEKVDSMLTEALGQPVELVRESDVSHLDRGPVHVVTSASLRWLGAVMASGARDERRFRPNLVIDTASSDRVEDDWVHGRLAVGDAVRLSVTSRTERCGMIGFAQSDLPKDTSILEQLVARADARFGVYATVIVPGTIRRGDPVTLGRLDAS